jgi:16S rRNA G1207 methylase RsmC
MDWSKLYPQMSSDSRVEFADIGCGYGGLLGINYFCIRVS